MNILVLDDRGSSSYYLMEWLKIHEYTVYTAFNLNDAQSIWDNRATNPIHCIILDLNVPTDGLKDEQKERSKGGLISGWVWLKENVLFDEPQMKYYTIIYSDYIHCLDDNIEEEYEEITFIPKRQRSSSAEDVTKRIIQIAEAIALKNENKH